jgi:hypothetical protein
MPGMSHGRDIKDRGSVGKERAGIVLSGVKLRPECHDEHGQVQPTGMPFLVFGFHATTLL